MPIGPIFNLVLNEHHNKGRLRFIASRQDLIYSLAKRFKRALSQKNTPVLHNLLYLLPSHTSVCQRFSHAINPSFKQSNHLSHVS